MSMFLKIGRLLILVFIFFADLHNGDKMSDYTTLAPTSTSAVDVSNEYNFNICGDNLQKPEANLELRTSNNFETLQLYQFGKIWPLSNRSFPINVACNLHLSACSACIIQLSWNNGQNKITLDPSKSSALRQPCDKPWDFKYGLIHFSSFFLAVMTVLSIYNPTTSII